MYNLTAISSDVLDQFLSTPWCLVRFLFDLHRAVPLDPFLALFTAAEVTAGSAFDGALRLLPRDRAHLHQTTRLDVFAVTRRREEARLGCAAVATCVGLSTHQYARHHQSPGAGIDGAVSTYFAVGVLTN